MAPASSAQREPSMEEILASIRRIIEDSDAAQKRPDEPAARFPANEPLPAAKAEVEAFRAELRPVPEIVPERHPVAPPAAEPAQATELPKAFRLAEVQAQVAREVAAQFKAPEPEKRPVTLADVQQQLAHQQLAKQTAVAAPSTVSAAPTSVSTGLDNSAAPAVEAKPERAYEPVTLDLPRAEPLPKASVIVASTTEAGPKPAIISPSAGRQVAAAFGELSEAFAARSKKTFDDLAEQMLRPMLQDWLDNNLPILVERLVREEIERVARGVE
jgi:cell pole-organizing protein PopZ